MRGILSAIAIAAIAGPAAAQQIGGSAGMTWNGPGTAQPQINVGGSGFQNVGTDVVLFGGDNTYGRGLVTGWGPSGYGAGTAYTVRAPNGEMVAGTFQMVITPGGTSFGQGAATTSGPGFIQAGGNVGMSPAGPFGSINAGGAGNGVNAESRVQHYGFPPPYFPMSGR